MRRAVLLILIGVVLMSATSIARKPPNEVFYPITIDKLGEFIAAMDYKYDKITTSEGGERLNFRIKGDNGVYDVNVILFESIDIVYIYVGKYLTLPLEDDHTGFMLSYLMTKNWELTFGKLEWDINDGEVRLSHTLPIDDGMSQQTFQAYLSTLMNVADNLLPDLIEAMDTFGE